MSDPLWKVQAEADVESILTKPWRIPCDMCFRGRGEKCKVSCPGEFYRSQGRDTYGNERGGRPADQGDALRDIVRRWQRTEVSDAAAMAEVASLTYAERDES